MELLLRKPGKMIYWSHFNATQFNRTGDADDVEIMSEKSADEVTAEQLKKKLQAEEEDGVVCIE